MKKTFFQRTHNLSTNLIVFALLSLLFNIGINLLIKMLKSINLPGMHRFFTTTLDKLIILEHYLHLLSFCIIIIPVLLVFIEFVQRLSKDSLWNYFKSIYQTSRMRQFLKQDVHFNQSVLGCTVDVRKDSVTFSLAIPKTQQTQKLLREMEDDIREEMSNRNPGYYFSSAFRKGEQLWLIGTKR